MEDGGSLIVFIIMFIVIILVIRAFGAWMLRINVVIDELKKINKKLDNKTL